MNEQLVGAWVPPERGAIDLAGREAMLALSATGPLVEGRHHWLTGATARTGPDGAVASVGFVASDDDDPEGSYARARVDGAGRLTLTRSISGGERLYFTVVEGVVLFASTLRALLAHPAVERRVDLPAFRDLLLNGHPAFGSATGIAGIEEVKPGHDACFGGGLRGTQDWTRDDFLRPPEGDVPTLARAFRRELARAVELAIGKERPVAIALSGGIDSSAIAAAAVEVVEASQIRAYSWEFDDPTHPVETPYAKMVSRRLGIARHEVFPIEASAFLGAIPEHLWRSESAVHWPKAFLSVVSRRLVERGHGRYLTGFGIGSHMGYLADLGEVLRWLGGGPWLAATFAGARFGHAAWPHRLERIHPGLEPPHPRLYPMLAEVLCCEGRIDDHRAMFPPELGPLIAADARTTEAGGRDFAERLQRQAMSHLISCIDVTRSEKASRELGIHRIAPAHFRTCLPYAYYPIRPALSAFGGDRRQRPGKLLLKHAYRGVLPDEVLFRVKDWADAVVSPAWRRRARVQMLRALPHFPGDLGRLDPRLPEAVEWWEPRSIQANCLSQRLWLELFVDRAPRDTAPSWAELWKLPSRSVHHDKLVVVS